MTQTQILQFLQVLGVKNVVVKGNGWVIASCPLARWMHKSGSDNIASFGIHENPGGRSHFNCFACRTGSAEELLLSFERHAIHDGVKVDLSIAHAILRDELQVLPLPEYEEFPSNSKPFDPWPEWWLDFYPPALTVPVSREYLLVTRRFPEEIVTQFDLRWDAGREMILAPYRDVNGLLAGARGRSVNPSATAWKKHYDYTFNEVNNAGKIWFNEGVLNLSGPVVAVEGQFDCARVAMGFPKVVAALTAKPPLEKLTKLAYSEVLIHIPDTDTTGEQSRDYYTKACAMIGLEYRPLILSKKVKDPDECHHEYLRDRILELSS